MSIDSLAGSAIRHPTVALIALVVFACSCTTWTPATVGPRALLEADPPDAIRIEHLDGASSVVRQPVLDRDSIFSASSQVPVAALADVRSVEVERYDAVATVAAFVLVPVAFFALVWRMHCALRSDSNDGWQYLC